MRAVIQRVLEASVEVDQQVVGAIQHGLLIYVGVAVSDTADDAQYLAEKVRFLRVFEDAEGKMNLDIAQVNGGVLVISAFTVQADGRKGRRPSFDPAARGQQALKLYESFCEELQKSGPSVARGVFGAYMHVHSANDGPICILLDTQRVF